MGTLVLLAFLAQADAEQSSRLSRIERTPGARVLGRNAGAKPYVYAAFEFAPPTGVGMTGECAATSPTGAKGEALTFSRASAATCTKGTNGLRTTDIADGDLVYVSSNIIRQEKDANGVLGVLVEEGRTNYALRSEEMDNTGVWNLVGTGVAAPTITANATTRVPASAPYSLPERIQIPAANASQNSFVSQAGVCGIGQACSVSVYALANGSACNLDICTYVGGTFAQCSRTALSTTTWSQLRVPGQAYGGTGNIFIGSMPTEGSPVLGANGACDAFIWGAQAEPNPFSTAYIPTTSASVARVADDSSTTPLFAFSGGVMAAGSMSFSAQTPANSLGTNRGYSTLTQGGNFAHGFIGFAASSAGSFYVNSAISTAFAVSSGSHRFAGYWGVAGNGNLVDATLTTTTGTAGTSNISGITIGGYSAASGTLQTGIYAGFCADPNPLRCR